MACSVNSHWCRAIAIVAIVAFLDGCAPGVTVPRPNATPARPIPPLETSTIRVPVTIDLASILTQAEAAVPREFKASNDWTVVDRNAIGDLGLRFEATRDPLKLAVR